MAKMINSAEIVVKNLEKLLFSQDFSDFSVILEDCGFKIPVHSQVLACASEYFSGLLYGPYVEGSSRELRVFDVDKDTFCSLLQYMYTGKAEVTLGNVVKLIQGANRFLITEALKSFISITKEFIEELDSSEVSLEKMTNLLIEAYINQNEEICEICFEYIDTNTEAFLNSKSIFKLDEELLALIIQRDTLFDGLAEISLFLACLRWGRGYGTLDPEDPESFDLSAIPENKRPALSSIVQHIRLSLIEPKYIINKIDKTDLFSTETLYKSISYHLCPDVFSSEEKKLYQERIGSKKPWTWSEDKIGSHILLSSDKKMAIAHYHDWEKVLGDTIWHAGTHSFKVYLDLNISVSSNLWQIIVGVASPRTSMHDHLGAGKQEWGLACYSGHKISCGDQREEYSSGCSKGDIIEVKLDLHHKKLEFLKNGENLGLAFNNLTGPVIPAVSLLKGQRVKLIWD